MSKNLKKYIFWFHVSYLLREAHFNDTWSFSVPCCSPVILVWYIFLLRLYFTILVTMIESAYWQKLFFIAAYYGNGVYFALKATYSARTVYSRPDNQGHKRIYLCNVLTGEYTTGKQGMRIPPQKTGQQAHILYDSLVNSADAKQMEMFIIFNDTQAYPAYLITFTKVQWWMDCTRLIKYRCREETIENNNIIIIVVFL